MKELEPYEHQGSHGLSGGNGRTGNVNSECRQVTCTRNDSKTYRTYSLKAEKQKFTNVVFMSRYLSCLHSLL